jgi:hypothetical protein
VASVGHGANSQLPHFALWGVWRPPARSDITHQNHGCHDGSFQRGWVRAAGLCGCGQRRPIPPLQFQETLAIAIIDKGTEPNCRRVPSRPPRTRLRRPQRGLRSLRDEGINPQRHARRPPARRDSRRQRPHQAINPGPKTSAPSDRRRDVIGLGRRISCPASPYATTKSAVRLTDHTSRTIARQPRAARSSFQT